MEEQQENPSPRVVEIVGLHKASGHFKPPLRLSGLLAGALALGALGPESVNPPVLNPNKKRRDIFGVEVSPVGAKGYCKPRPQGKCVNSGKKRGSHNKSRSH